MSWLLGPGYSHLCHTLSWQSIDTKTAEWHSRYQRNALSGHGGLGQRPAHIHCPQGSTPGPRSPWWEACQLHSLCRAGQGRAGVCKFCLGYQTELGRVVLSWLVVGSGRPTRWQWHWYIRRVTGGCLLWPGMSRTWKGPSQCFFLPYHSRESPLG